MTNLLASYEKVLLGKLKSDDKDAFTIIFTNYYADLVRFSYTYTKNQDISEEIVQEVFLRFWENRKLLEIQNSLKSFLLKSVQNRSIDWLRHLNTQNKYASIILENPVLSENNTENYILQSELQSHILLAIKKIPGQYSEVFVLSRVNKLSYKEIAEKLGLSNRTVKDRISKALSILRNELKDFLILTLFYYLFFNLTS